MPSATSSLIAALSHAIQQIPREWTEKQRAARRFLFNDPLEELVPVKLLKEGLGQFFDRPTPPANSSVLFMDRAGGRLGLKGILELIPLFGEKWPGLTLIYVAFATPTRGIGTLMRNSLVHSGANHGVNIHVVAHNRPAEGLGFLSGEAEALTRDCDIVISCSPGGSGGLINVSDDLNEDALPLIKRSHLSVLSFPDPEGLVAELKSLHHLMVGDARIDALDFKVRVRREDKWEPLGNTLLGENGDAEDRLWVLLDNARRHLYEVLVQPLSSGLPSGIPLRCPCRSLLEARLERIGTVSRIVPVGSKIVVLVRGKNTLM